VIVHDRADDAIRGLVGGDAERARRPAAGLLLPDGRDRDAVTGHGLATRESTPGSSRTVMAR
jgi:hypothetical protein